MLSWLMAMGMFSMAPHGTTSVPFAVPKGTKATPGILVHRASRENLVRREIKEIPENLVRKA
jgi:hypothetical protein